MGAAVQVPAGTLDPMATSGRSPRVWIDVELGATFGSPAASIDIFHEFSSAIGPPTEAWFFHRDRAPLVRGFYYPLVAPITTKVQLQANRHLEVVEQN